MENEPVSVDVALFARTASLFAAKRRLLPEEAVVAVAAEIVRRLADRPLRVPDFELPQISPERLKAFCQALIQPDPAAALHFIQARRDEGLTRQGIYLGYVAGGARLLGEVWDADRISFLQVTSGTGHLYALMRALRTETQPGLPRDGRVALVATVPGEDHGLGITGAAEIFRDAGWEIDLATGTDHDSLMAQVERTIPQVIGLSLSTEERLDALIRLVVALRLVIPDAVIGVAPASSVDAGRLHDLVDIDLVFADAPQAFRDLERLLRLRG